MSGNGESERSKLAERFPSLRRIARLRLERKIPFVAPVTQRDCGVACLSMVLGYYGREVRVEDLRSVTSLSPQGTSLYDLLNAGKMMGLNGRGVAVEADEIEYLD